MVLPRQRSSPCILLFITMVINNCRRSLSLLSGCMRWRGASVMHQNYWYQKQQQVHMFLSPQKRSINTATTKATITTNQKNIRIPKNKISENESSEITSVINTEDGFLRPSLVLVDKVIELLQKLEEPVGSLPGVGPVTQSILTEQMNLPTIRSLLWNFPHSAIDRTKVITDLNAYNNLIKDGDIVTCIINVEGTFQGRQFLTLNCCIDGKPSDKIKVTFFHGSSNKGRGVVAGIKKQVFGSHHHQNRKKVVSGKIKIRGSKANISYEMVNPDIVCSIDQLDSALMVEPVYRLTKGLTQTKLRQTVKEAIKVATNLLEQIMPADQYDTLPPNLRKALNWPTFVDALYAAHNPKSLDDVGPNSAARKRIAFEEMRVQQSQLALIRWHFKTKFPSSKQQQQKSVAPSFKSWQESPLVSLAISLLPFSLTNSQMNCLTEVWNDSIFSQASNDNNRMERVLQGDTGSGKTVVGYLTSLGCFEARLGGACVAAFLAPTTLLAEQHSQSLGKMVAKLNDALSDHRNNADSIKIRRIHVELLTRDVTGQKRAEIFNRFENCSDDEAFFLVGTHALLTPETTSRLRILQVPSNLGYGLCLSIIDEEQRFGVLQRESLTACSAHTLYLSATPVPRTLALGGSSSGVLVGSLDVSTLTEKPTGARKVKTSIIDVSNVDEVVLGVQRQIAKGAKVFWIMPAISADENMEVDKSVVGEMKDSSTKYAIDRHAALLNILGDNRVGLVHGRMPHREREKQIENFKDPKSGVDVLVGTTVLEVGVDIPSVTILVVEGADRFGLSQLHQLRGRVGRVISTNREMVEDTSRALDCHCILLTSKLDKPVVKYSEKLSTLDRLQVLKDFDDGARIAVADFTIRGPGDLLGKRQSGFCNGYCIEPRSHWGMIAAASKLGRFFLEGSHQRMSLKTKQRKNEESLYSQQIAEFGCAHEGTLIEAYLEHGLDETFYANASASSMNGIILRAFLALFGQWTTSLEQQQSTGYYFSILSQALETRGQQSDTEKKIERKFLFLAQALGSDVSSLSRINVTSKSMLVEASILNYTKLTPEGVKDVTLPSNTAHMAPTGLNESMVLNSSIRLPGIVAPTATQPANEVASLKIIEAVNFQRVNLQNDDDVAILLLDVETTGLSPQTDHIIQLAAKLLGRDEIFCEYVLPPVSISPQIEKLTGITQKFLLHGGLDSYTGISHSGPAKDFRTLYQHFCDFCQRCRTDSRKICLVAHNAAFDVRFLNAEVKRLSLADALAAEGVVSPQSISLPPMLSRDTGITTTVDTLRLFKNANFWPGTALKPKSFALGDLYQVATQKKLSSAHHAVADIMALEEILTSPHFNSKWRKVASEIQTPLFSP